MREPISESHEKALRVARSLLADDLDRVLVRSNGAVGAEAIENAADDVGRLGDEPGSYSRLVFETSSVMPIVKWFFGDADARLSNTPLTIAGVNSLDARP